MQPVAKPPRFRFMPNHALLDVALLRDGDKVFNTVSGLDLVDKWSGKPIEGGVRVVASLGHAGDWAAYGASERQSSPWTVRHGTKLSEEAASALFPLIAAVRRYRE